MKNTKMVTTNLRIPESDWLQIKAFAAEEGKSMNEYIQDVISSDMTKKQLGDAPLKRAKKKKLSFWDLGKIMSTLPYEPEELSEEDEIIYGT